MHILLITELSLFSAEVDRDLKIPKLENAEIFFLYHCLMTERASSSKSSKLACYKLMEFRLFVDF